MAKLYDNKFHAVCSIRGCQSNVLGKQTGKRYIYGDIAVK